MQKNQVDLKRFKIPNPQKMEKNAEKMEKKIKMIPLQSVANELGADSTDQLPELFQFMDDSAILYGNLSGNASEGLKGRFSYESVAKLNGNPEDLDWYSLATGNWRSISKTIEMKDKDKPKKKKKKESPQ
eukprot:TRINITY_DN3740_c0_g1_i1.p1 TRINITY_DN3740_c0_g1~~TRINITY_DN3740_c0_g1_i1.p1  ORF type:complete len:130 (-),score=54.96 TRINITY_DN3740_c0_g1_i1:25-414(-)